MKVTREVIYDLLPAYFAGDASDDTRSLIDEFFASDPEFGRMAERFRTLMAQKPSPETASEADGAKIGFERARTRVKLRLAAVVWALGAALPLAMAALAGFSGGRPGLILVAVFAAMAAITWLMSLSSRPEKWYAAFSGEDRS